MYYVDRMSVIDRSVHLESFAKLDVRYQYTINRDHEIKLELIGYNVGGRPYSDYRDRQSHQRSYLMKVSGRF